MMHQPPKSLSDWLDYLERLHSKKIDLGLERVTSVAKELQVLKPAPFVFTVAGTNGKGTTCRTLEMILIAAGYRVGVYSSPHILEYAERVRIQNATLPDSEHVDAFEHVNSVRGETSLTFFEFSTLSALYLFKQHRVDVAILEVGLGGRLDATNIVEPDMAVITTIALDHTDWLGETREAIAVEKAGIIRSHKPAVVGDPCIPDTLLALAAQNNVQLYSGYPNKDHAWSYEEHAADWSFSSTKHAYSHLPLPQVPLANAATALAALTYSTLTYSAQAIIEGLRNTSLVGRFQIVQSEPLVILDAAHNPHASAYLAHRLAKLNRSKGRTKAVLGMLTTKDIEGTIANISGQIDDWYCASLDGESGASSDVLKQYLPQATCYDAAVTAWQQAMRCAQKEDTIIVFGSFHTIAQILRLINQRDG